MTPASKEEIYLAKLCGEDWKLPYPASRLEYYYAKLCGMDVPLPAEPLSRPELYLAYLCGMDVKLPKPVSRKEMYMAKACGMEIVNTPDPLSKGEKYWCDFIAHIEEFNGKLPLTCNSKGLRLINYRIYGNEENIEQITNNQYMLSINCTGKNQFKLQTESAYVNGVDINVTNGKIVCNGTASEDFVITLGFMDYKKDLQYKISGCPDGGNTTSSFRLFFDNIGSIPDSNGRAFQPDKDYPHARVRLFIYKGYYFDHTTFTPQVEISDTITDFEPYHLPVVTEIYIGDKPLRTGDYIDYQKQVRVDADKTVTPLALPSITTFNGTTIISALAGGISMQMYIKYIAQITP